MQVPALEDVATLVKQPLIAKIATHNRDGSIRISPAWFRESNGVYEVNTWENTGLVRNIRRDPRASLLIDTTDHPYKGVHLTGRAEVLRETSAEEMGEMFAPYVGSLEAATAYGRKLKGWGKRVMVGFRPEGKAITWDFSRA